MYEIRLSDNLLVHSANDSITTRREIQLRVHLHLAIEVELPCTFTPFLLFIASLFSFEGAAEY
jgi:hypothetical protein